MLAVGKKIRIGDIITFNDSYVKTFEYDKLYSYKPIDYNMFLLERGIDISFFESVVFKKACALYNVNYEHLKDIYMNNKNIKYNEPDTDYISTCNISYHANNIIKSNFNKIAFVVDFIKEKDIYKTYGKFICKDIYGNYIFPYNIEKIKKISDIDLTYEQYYKNFTIINKDFGFRGFRFDSSEIKNNAERSYTEFVRKYNLYWINRIE